MSNVNILTATGGTKSASIRRNTKWVGERRNVETTSHRTDETNGRIENKAQVR